MSSNNATLYFMNLLLVSLIVWPIFYSCRSVENRERIMIALGLWMLFGLSPVMLLIWPIYWLLVWAFIRLSEIIQDERSRNNVFVLSILIILLPMLMWKLHDEYFVIQISTYSRAFFSACMPIMNTLTLNSTAAATVGLSFSTFRALDLLTGVHLGLIEKPRMRQIFHYGFFAPILIIGPIIQYKELAEKSACSENRYENLIYGLARVAWGWTKLFFLAFPLASTQHSVSHLETAMSHSPIWLCGQILLFIIYIYLNFSSYCDIAIGIGRIYGFTLGENFNNPFLKLSLQQFWGSWHMSLSSFAQRNIFIPLGGFRIQRQYFATFMTMMVIALWHGLTLAMLFFGILHSAVLIWLRIKSNRQKKTSNASRPMQVLYATATFLFVAFTSPLLMLSNDSVVPFYRYLIMGGR